MFMGPEEAFSFHKNKNDLLHFAQSNHRASLPSNIILLYRNLIVQWLTWKEIKSMQAKEKIITRKKRRKKWKERRKEG